MTPELRTGGLNGGSALPSSSDGGLRHLRRNKIQQSKLIDNSPWHRDRLITAASKGATYFPTRSVSRALEDAGLIVWRIWRRGGFTRPFPENDPQGWYITEKGDHVLKVWESPNDTVERRATETQEVLPT